jgi:hypothetical protein
MIASQSIGVHLALGSLAGWHCQQQHPERGVTDATTTRLPTNA